MTIPGTMTLAELQKLVAESKGEWGHLEFKNGLALAAAQQEDRSHPRDRGGVVTHTTAGFPR